PDQLHRARSARGGLFGSSRLTLRLAPRVTAPPRSGAGSGRFLRGHPSPACTRSVTAPLLVRVRRCAANLARESRAELGALPRLGKFVPPHNTALRAAAVAESLGRRVRASSEEAAAGESFRRGCPRPTDRHNIPNCDTESGAAGRRAHGSQPCEPSAVTACPVRS